MANRAVREGIVSVGKAARVKGTDLLKMREFWYPRGIVRAAILMREESETGCSGRVHLEHLIAPAR